MRIEINNKRTAQIMDLILLCNIEHEGSTPYVPGPCFLFMFTNVFTLIYSITTIYIIDRRSSGERLTDTKIKHVCIEHGIYVIIIHVIFIKK